MNSIHQQERYLALSHNAGCYESGGDPIPWQFRLQCPGCYVWIVVDRAANHQATALPSAK